MRYACDLGGTHVRIAATDSGAGWRHGSRVRRVAGMTPAMFVDHFSRLVAQWNMAAPESIGISVAAVVDGEGSLLAAENLGWKDVPLRRLMEEAFGCPVTVETDVFCGATYEARLGAAKGLASALYVGVGTGVGHAFILDGRVWRGAARGANAFGHLIVQPEGRPCYCGHRGCLCTIASGLAQETAAGAGPCPLASLALALGNAITLIEPERIILAGGALNQPWFDLAALARLVPLSTYPAAKQPQLVRSDAEDPNLRGALLLSTEQS